MYSGNNSKQIQLKTFVVSLLNGKIIITRKSRAEKIDFASDFSSLTADEALKNRVDCSREVSKDK